MLEIGWVYRSRNSQLLELEPTPKAIPEYPRLADGTLSKAGAITHEIDLTVLVGNGFPPYHSTFQVMSLGSAPILLGLPFLRALRPQINWANRTILPPISDPDQSTVSQISVNATVIPEQYHSYTDVFDKREADKLPPHRPFDHRIPLVEGKTPPFGPIYSLSQTEQVALREYLDENLAKEFIVPSESSAASPILFVKKKDGSLRLCVDYRRLNDMTLKNRYPLPLIGDLLDKLKSAKIYTKIDLRGAYNLLRIEEGDQWKTAFRTRLGLYEYRVMPFGLTNAPASFQYLMNHIFRDVLDIYVIVYLDDILVFSNNEESHIQHVQTVLERLRQHQLFAKLEKCDFHTTHTEFLGYIISPRGVEMDPAKVKAVTQWPVPKNLKELQGFLGFVNFYRRFIVDFSALAKPLHELTRKDVRFVFEGPQMASFNSIKQSITSAPILRHFDPADPVVVETDASDYALGAIISQTDSAGISRPVAFMSRSLSPAELNYAVHDKEFLAIVSAFKEWRHYLEGSSKPVVVHTDHRSLESFMISKQLTRRQARWSEFMSEFNIQIVYRPGKQSTKPDALSRRPDYRPSDTDSTSLSRQLNEHNYKSLVDTSQSTFHNVDTALSNPAINHADLSNSQSLSTIHAVDVDFLNIQADTRAAYASDPEYPELENLARTGRHGYVEIQGGLLSYKGALYIPHSMRTRIFQECHDSLPSGHPGQKKTLANIRRHYWWPTLMTDTIEYVSTCTECQRTKIPRQKPLGFLMSLPVPERPWQHVTADFIVQLPPSNGYDAILVVVDRLTKMAIFVPTTSDIDAPLFAKLFINHVYSKHGLPDTLTTDRGTQFKSRFWTTMAELLGVQSKFSTSYHPQTDGQTEIVNQWLEQYLRLYSDFEQSNWSGLLPVAELCYNTTVHSSTGVSPIRALTGLDPRTSFSKTPDPNETRSIQAIDVHGELNELRTYLRERLGRIQAQQATYYNRKRRSLEFSEGDKVMLRATHIRTLRPSKKLDSRNLGPFTITRKINPNAYELALPDSMRIHKVFHISLLSPYRTRDVTPLDLADDPIQVIPDVTREIESILDNRITAMGEKEYLVKWIGYDTSDNSWEPLSRLQGNHTWDWLSKAEEPKRRMRRTGRRQFK